MRSEPVPAKSERLREFFRRLAFAPVAATADEAVAQISDILNAVEDELTEIPFNPSSWETDGRMYPVQADNVRSVKGWSDLKRYVSKAHSTIIGNNGSIEIQARGGKILFTKPGADGRSTGEVR